MSSQFSSKPLPPPMPSRKPSASTPAKQDPKSNNQKLLIRGGLGLLLLLLLIGAGYAFLMPDGAEQAKAKFSDVKNNSELSEDEKRAKSREIWEGLSPDAKKKLRDERFEDWRQKDNERLKAFFAKSPQEQRKEMRERIQRDEKRRKEWEARAKERGIVPGGGGPGGAAGAAGGTAGNAQANAQGGAAAAGNTNNGPGSGRPKMSAEEKQQRRDEFLDRFTPEERAMRNQERIMMNEIRVQMGLPPRVSGRGGFFGGGGGGGRGGPGGGGPRPQSAS